MSDITILYKVLIDIAVSEGDILTLTKLYTSSDQNRMIIDSRLKQIASVLKVPGEWQSLPDLIRVYDRKMISKLPYKEKLKYAIDVKSIELVKEVLHYIIDNRQIKLRDFEFGETMQDVGINSGIIESLINGNWKVLDLIIKMLVNLYDERGLKYPYDEIVKIIYKSSHINPKYAGIFLNSIKYMYKDTHPDFAKFDFQSPNITLDEIVDVLDDDTERMMYEMD